MRESESGTVRDSTLKPQRSLTSIKADGMSHSVRNSEEKINLSTLITTNANKCMDYLLLIMKTLFVEHFPLSQSKLLFVK